MLTDRTIANAKPADRDLWLTDKGAGRGVGRLVLRVTAGGARIFYFRYTNTTGKRVHVRLGDYATDASGMTLAKARNKLREMQGLYLAPESRDVREHLAERVEKETARRETEARQRTNLKQHTLRALCEEYAALLDRKGKTMSGRDARGIFRLHTKIIADLPAAHVTARQVVEVVRKLTDAGKLRTAGKLRSYLHAAFALAARAEMDPAAPSALLAFGITANPVSPVATMADGNKARSRSLSESELRSYMARMKELPDMSRDALRLSLLLGGQRPTQLLRLRLCDVDLTDGTLRLFDPKGKRKQARLHVLPITDGARAVLQPILDQRTRRAAAGDDIGEWVFSNDGGETAVRAETLSTAVHNIETAMRGKKESREPFQMRDLRRTAETMLAALGVSKDVRAQILSHGLGSLQDRVYDQHDYLPEKCRALKAWENRLRQIADARPAPSNVVRMETKTTRKAMR